MEYYPELRRIKFHPDFVGKICERDKTCTRRNYSEELRNQLAEQQAFIATDPKGKVIGKCVVTSMYREYSEILSQNGVYGRSEAHKEGLSMGGSDFEHYLDKVFGVSGELLVVNFRLIENMSNVNITKRETPPKISKAHTTIFANDIKIAEYVYNRYYDDRDSTSDLETLRGYVIDTLVDAHAYTLNSKRKIAFSNLDEAMSTVIVPHLKNSIRDIARCEFDYLEFR